MIKWDKLNLLSCFLTTYKPSSLICMATMHWLNIYPHSVYTHIIHVYVCIFQMEIFGIYFAFFYDKLFSFRDPSLKIKHEHLEETSIWHDIWRRCSACELYYIALLNMIIVCNCLNLWTPVAFAVCQTPLIIANVQ